jgi:hypothetical protein
MVSLMDGAPLQRELAEFHPVDRKVLRRAAMCGVAVVDDKLVTTEGNPEKMRLLRA